MTITHHPDIASLMCCSAGSQPEAFAAVISSHLSVCPACRAEVGRMQRIGAALFEALPGADVSAAAPIVALRAGEADAATAEIPTALAAGDDVPLPLVPVLGRRLDDLPWRWKAPGVWTHSIVLSVAAEGELTLIKAAPGTVLPEHGHHGQELTIVLRGGYTDALGTFRAGDVADLDASVEHSPVACPVDGCICLSARDGDLHFKGRFARLLQPLMNL